MSAIPDPAHALTATGNLRRRQAVSRAFVSLTVAAAALAVAVLLILVYYVFKQGIHAISLRFYTSDLPSYTGVGGGIGPALVGTIELVLIATLIALPVGLLTALYLTQFAGPRADRVLRLILDLMAGLPTIIIGVFVAGLITNRFGQSALAGGLALSIVEVPLIARASLEAISRVPEIACRRRRRVGRRPLADDHRRDPADSVKRDRHRDDPRGRARGGRNRAASVHNEPLHAGLLDQPAGGGSIDPAGDLLPAGIGLQGVDRKGMGRCVHADGRDPGS